LLDPSHVGITGNKKAEQTIDAHPLPYSDITSSVKITYLPGGNTIGIIELVLNFTYILVYL